VEPPRPKRRACFLIAFSLVLWVGGGMSLCADEVYKYVDADGHLVFSDRAPTKTAQKSQVRVDQPDAAQAAQNAKETQLLKAEDTQRKRQEALDERNKQVQDQLKRNKQIQCENARSRYYTLRDSGLIYHTDPNGNRTYYSDTEADARREDARRLMAAACAP
jgi:preprotein translocase subunit SecF